MVVRARHCSISRETTQFSLLAFWFFPITASDFHIGVLRCALNILVQTPAYLAYLANPFQEACALHESAQRTV